MNISRQLSQIKNELDKLKNDYEDKINKYLEQLGLVSVELDKLTQTWAGDWTNNYNVYRDISEGDQEYLHLNFDQISDLVEESASVKTTIIWTETGQIIENLLAFNEDVITELSIIKGKAVFVEQVKLLEKIENFEWGFAATRVVQMKQPKNLLISYEKAQSIYSGGLQTPPHIAYGAVLISKGSELKAVQDYLKLVRRILREIEILEGVDDSGTKSPMVAQKNLDNLLDNFHNVAKQLANRHSNRNTLIIQDEYDVQDLLHALLRINYDDVRPEDYTSSYAGRNTRVDFLLKKERIIIEVKKTRATLKDKDIGDELLQDISRYRSHPDCDVLYCFVYDPQSIIINPRGLENDLNSESRTGFTVKTIIRP